MPYDPDEHRRRSIRLKGHDYSQPGAYFVTICTRDRECLFGHVVNGEMRLNEAGEIARRCWQDIPDHFPLIELDAFVLMPNHVQGIIVIHESCKGEASEPLGSLNTRMGVADASPLRQRPNGTQSGSLSAIVQNFKSVSTRKMNAACRAPGTPVWLRNYYEHVVRNDDDLQAIRKYILGNPARWDEDENNPALTNPGVMDHESTGVNNPA
jgi:putative transposase